MKIMAGIIPFDSGLVKLGHQVKVGYFAQHQSESLISDRTVLEEAVSASPKLTEQEVRNLLGAFLFSGDDVYKKVKVLSGGEKSRLALTKILLSPPNLLLMDEPTNHLDIPSCEILEAGLKKFSGTLVLITHDRRLMNSVCTGILEIEPGRAEYYLGNYEEYQYKKKLDSELENPEITETPSPKNPDEDESKKESKKDRKRKEAELRHTLSKLRAPIQKQIKQIETELEKKETRKKHLQALMADPKTYENKELLLPLIEELPIVETEIKSMEEKWEELQAELESIEEKACI
jgi:ATP-binding cassette subfamily F protein 3